MHSKPRTLNAVSLAPSATQGESFQKGLLVKHLADLPGCVVAWVAWRGVTTVTTVPTWHKRLLCGEA